MHQKEELPRVYGLLKLHDETKKIGYYPKKSKKENEEARKVFWDIINQKNVNETFFDLIKRMEKKHHVEIHFEEKKEKTLLKIITK